MPAHNTNLNLIVMVQNEAQGPSTQPRRPKHSPSFLSTQASMIGLIDIGDTAPFTSLTLHDIQYDSYGMQHEKPMYLRS